MLLFLWPLKRKENVNMEKKSNKKIIIISCVALAVLIAAFGIIYCVTRPETAAGSKTINVDIVFAADNTKTVEINTDAEYLGDALKEKNLIEGTKSEYGLFITSVDGVAAGDGQWWCIKQNGEMTPSGADTTPIKDGDTFTLELSTY